MAYLLDESSSGYDSGFIQMQQAKENRMMLLTKLINAFLDAELV